MSPVQTVGVRLNHCKADIRRSSHTNCRQFLVGYWYLLRSQRPVEVIEDVNNLSKQMQFFFKHSYNNTTRITNVFEKEVK